MLTFPFSFFFVSCLANKDFFVATQEFIIFTFHLTFKAPLAFPRSNFFDYCENAKYPSSSTENKNLENVLNYFLKFVFKSSFFSHFFVIFDF